MQRSEIGSVFAALQKIIDALSSGDLQAVVDNGTSGHLTHAELARALNDYPGRVVAQKTDPGRANIIAYAHDPHAGMIEYELETDDGASDLTLSCEYRLNQPPLVRIENIHVL